MYTLCRMSVDSGITASQRAWSAMLGALFAISGGSALALQVVWTRWLVLALGASNRAAIVVLAVFMVGLGAGALVGGRIADAKPRLVLRLFACAEGGIGVWALLSVPLAGRWLPELSSFVAGAFGAEALPLWARTAFAVLVLAPPTFLMGATLPLLASWSLSERLLPGRSVGMFYAVNTLGGGVGALLASLVLIDRLGLAGTAVAAGAADALIAGAVLLLGRLRAPVPASASDGRGGASSVEASGSGNPDAPQGFGPFLAPALGYTVSGFVGLGLEVVSHRVIGARLGSSVYGFAVMLSALLVGIALGSLAAARGADRTRAPILWMGWTLGGLALGIGISKWAYASHWWILEAWHPSAELVASPWAFLLELAGCFGVLLFPGLALGAIVPLVARVAGLAPSRTASRLGAAYACNTAGSVAGAVLCGVVLIPGFGSAATLTILSVVAGVAGVVVIVTSGLARSRGTLAATGVILATATGLAIGWRSDPVQAALRSWGRNGTMLGFREGPVRAVAVFEESNDLQLDFRRIVADQTSFAATHLRARRYMSLLGLLPLAWARDPRSALVICFGTGTTAMAVGSDPRIERIDIAEISPEVIEFAPMFRDANQDILSDPRVRLHVEDGRHIASSASGRWDVITLEPPPPRDSGVVSLYSAEFYQLSRRRLTDGGIVAQWCPLESQSQDEVRMIVRTFAAAFPFALAFLPVERDLILLGSDRPLRLDPNDLSELLRSGKFREVAEEIGLAEPEDILATAVADREAMRAFAGEGGEITDDRPRLEYFARYGRRPARPNPSPWIGSLPALDELLSSPPAPPLRERFSTARTALLDSLRAGWARTARRGDDFHRLSLEAAQLRPNRYFLWAAGLSDEHLERFTRSAERAGTDARLWLAVGLRESYRGRVSRAVAALRRTRDLGLEDPDGLYVLGVLLTEQGGEAAGLPHLRRFLELFPTDPRAERARAIVATARLAQPG